MTTLALDLPDLSIAVADITSADDFDQIRAPGRAAVLWRRAMRPEFQTWVDTLDPSRFPTVRTVLRPQAVAETLGRLCDGAGLEDGPERQWLQGDIAGLAMRFAALMSAPYVRLRIDTVSTNACSKFHMDAMLARLICTYRGHGTQYGLAPVGTDPTDVLEAPTGAPMILRGSLWPEDAPRTLKHRSPPIAGTGETRLVLVIDPVYDLEDAD